ncbi:Hypothetical protein D9617_16g014990 [Elsinoe fawcettii]|nr:Hypothetical protein D9617_16g014990 [Elsinoe fawcettii]
MASLTVPTAEQLLLSIGKVDALDEGTCVQKLQAAFLTTPSMTLLQTSFTNPDTNQNVRITPNDDIKRFALKAAPLPALRPASSTPRTDLTVPQAQLLGAEATLLAADNDASAATPAKSVPVTTMASTKLDDISSNASDTNSTSSEDDDDDPYNLPYQLMFDPSSSDPPNYSAHCGNAVVPQDDDGDYVWAKMRIEDCDKIRDALRAQSKKDNPDSDSLNLEGLGDLYSYNMFYDSSNRDVHKFELDAPDILITLSDEYQQMKQANPDTYQNMPPPVDNLHFTTILGCPETFVITKLFKYIELTVQPLGQTILGYACPYGLYKDGNRDSQVPVIGTCTADTPSLSTMMLAQAPTANADQDSPLAFNSAPSPVASALATVSDNTSTITDLINITYNNNLVHTSAQTMMSNVMQWHMDDNEREIFFGATQQPPDLPVELTTLLPTNVANWVKDTYARAYICSMMSANPGSIRSNYQFTAAERKQVRYFWTGHGAGTLAQSAEYKLLDRAIQRASLRKLYPPVQDAYAAGTGVQTSNSLLGFYMTPGSPAFGQLNNVDPSSGTSMLTKVCAIMDALDGGVTSSQAVNMNFKRGDQNKPITINDTNSNVLSFRLMAKNKGNAWANAWVGADQTNPEAGVQVLEAAWLGDCLDQFLSMVLSNDPSLSDPFKTAVANKIEEYGVDIQNWATMDIKTKVRQIVLEFGEQLNDFMDSLGVLLGWIKTGTQWVVQKVNGLIDRWRTGAGRVADAAAEITQTEDPKALRKAAIKTGFLTFVGLVALGSTIWNLSNKWSSGDAANRGLLIATVCGSLCQLGELGLDAVDAFMRWGAGSFSRATQPPVRRYFDEIMQKDLGSDAAIMDPDATAKGYFEPKSLFSRESSLCDELMEKKPILDDDTTFFDQMMESAQKITNIKRAFNIASEVLEGIGYFVAVAVAIFMTRQLVSDWSDMSLAEKIFNTIQTVISCIEGLGAAVIIGGTIIWGAATALVAGCAAACGTFVAATCSTFAAASVVLAAVAILVLIIYFIWSASQSPPPNAVETWMGDVEKPWADAIQMPALPFDILITPTSTITSSQTNVQCLEMHIKNNTAAAATSQGTTFQFTSGGNTASSVFYGEYQFALASDASPIGTAGTVNMITTNSQAQLSATNIQSDTDTTSTITWRNQLSVAGPPTTDQVTGLTTIDLTLAAGEEIVVQVYGTIWDGTGVAASVTWTQYWGNDQISDNINIDRTASPN